MTFVSVTAFQPGLLTKNLLNNWLLAF